LKSVKGFSGIAVISPSVISTPRRAFDIVPIKAMMPFAFSSFGGVSLCQKHYKNDMMQQSRK
jgi:hypothetical protein